MDMNKQKVLKRFLKKKKYVCKYSFILAVDSKHQIGYLLYVAVKYMHSISDNSIIPLTIYI